MPTIIDKQYIIERTTVTPCPEGYDLDDCWIWNASKVNDKGYAYPNINYKRVYIHRESFKLWGGVLTKEKNFVLHKCDIRACNNPKHLYAGNARDNAIDRKVRGRNGDITGSKNGRWTLSIEQRQEVCQLYSTKKFKMSDLSEMFGVCRLTISNILKTNGGKLAYL